MVDLVITQTRSTIGVPKSPKLVVKGLGLRGIGSQIKVKNSPSFRGMVKKIIYLISVSEQN